MSFNPSLCPKPAGWSWASFSFSALKQTLATISESCQENSRDFSRQSPRVNIDSKAQIIITRTEYVLTAQQEFKMLRACCTIGSYKMASTMGLHVYKIFSTGNVVSHKTLIQQ